MICNCHLAVRLQRMTKILTSGHKNNTMVVVVSITLFFLGQQLQQTTLMAHLHIQPRCSTQLPAKGALGSHSTQTTGQHTRVALSWENTGKHLTAKPPFSLTVRRCQTPCRWVYPMQWYLNYQKRDKFITIPVTPEAVLRLPRWKPSTDHLTQKHSQLPGHWLPPPSPFPSRTCPATPSSSSAWQWVLAVRSLKPTSTLLVFSKSRHSPSALKTGPSWLHSPSAKSLHVLHFSITCGTLACFQLLFDCCHSENHLGLLWKCMHLCLLK